MLERGREKVAMKDSACKKGVCAVVTMCEQEYVGVIIWVFKREEVRGRERERKMLNF